MLLSDQESYTSRHDPPLLYRSGTIHPVNHLSSTSLSLGTLFYENYLVLLVSVVSLNLLLSLVELNPAPHFRAAHLSSRLSLICVCPHAAAVYFLLDASAAVCPTNQKLVTGGSWTS